MFSNILFFLENRAVDDLMWKNTTQPDRPQMTIWRMRIDAGYPGLQRQYFPIATMVAGTLFGVTLYAHCPSCHA